MKWISIEEDVDPPFKKALLVIHSGSRAAVIGRLISITTRADSKEYEFDTHASEQWKELKITHWLEIPEIPY